MTDTQLITQKFQQARHFIQRHEENAMYGLAGLFFAGIVGSMAFINQGKIQAFLSNKAPEAKEKSTQTQSYTLNRSPAPTGKP